MATGGGLPALLRSRGPCLRPAEHGVGKDPLAADDPAALPRPADGAALLALICSPGLADKSRVPDQYHRYVRGDTALAVPEDSAAPHRLDPLARPEPVRLHDLSPRLTSAGKAISTVFTESAVNRVVSKRMVKTADALDSTRRPPAASGTHPHPQRQVRRRILLLVPRPQPSAGPCGARAVASLRTFRSPLPGD